jgi:4-amino-4-deoxy-L-arabinose transferase-like glycosyltransferase
MSRGRLIVLWAFIIAGIALRLAYIDRPAYLDESATFIDYTKLSFTEIASTYFDPNNHVFYSVLMRASYLLFGFDAPALRLPALLAGIAVLPLTFAVGRALYDDDVATLATGLAAGSAPLIEYSVSGRGYSLITAAMLALLWLPTRAGRWRWPLVAVVSALGFYTLPTMLYPMGIVGLHWVGRYATRREWRELGAFAGALVGGAALTLALYTPILLAYGFEALAGNRHVVALPYPDLLPALARLPLDVVDYLYIGLPRTARYGLALLVGVGLVVEALRWRAGVPLGVTTVAWLVVVLAVQRVVPPVRVWVFVAPLAGLWGAVGIVWAARHVSQGRAVMTAIMVVVPVAVGGLVLRADVNGGYGISSGAHDAEAAAAHIAGALAPDDTVLFVAGWVHPLWYELERRDLPRDRVLLTAPAVPDAVYLLAFRTDPYLDNRTREAFGVVFPAEALAPVVTFPAGEWTLYVVE